MVITVLAGWRGAARRGGLAERLHEAALGLVPDVGQAPVGSEQQQERVYQLPRLLLPFREDVHSLLADVCHYLEGSGDVIVFACCETRFFLIYK